MFASHSPTGRSSRPRAEPRPPSDRDLAALLRAFFRKRARADAGRPVRHEQVQLLVRRTLERLARRRTAAAEDAASANAPVLRAQVLRAALLELRQLDESPTPEGASPPRRRN